MSQLRPPRPLQRSHQPRQPRQPCLPDPHDADPSSSPTRSRAAGTAALLALLLAGCATWPGPVGKPAAAGSPPASTAAPATATPPATGSSPVGNAPQAADATAGAAADAAKPAAAQRPDPSAPKPFAEVIKGATRSDGYLPVWRKDDQVWLEIAPERLGQLMLMTANVTNSVGERGLYAGQMAQDAAVELRQVGKSLQVVARNMAFRASGDPAMARTVAQSFSDSLLAAAPVASAPHPEHKAVLVDASFLKADLVGYGTALERAFRLPYSLDRANSYFDAVRATPRSTALTTQLHFATPRIPAPPAGPVPPGAMQPRPPTATPDPRSFFVGVIVNFAALPEQPMRPRRADPRVGYFTESYLDLGNDLSPNPRIHVVRRWRLEKKDPAAELSEPVQPIVFWLDRNIPARYRGAVTAGVLEWNKAFERIGFVDALQVRQQPDDADFDTLGVEHASIRWFTGADAGFARGPSHADPRTGEILDADIAMSDVFGRGARRFIREDLGLPPFAQHPLAGTPWAAYADAQCSYALEAAQELAFALDLLEARGELDPESPEAEAFVQAQIKDTIMHEVGHTLGLRHNFRASTVVSREQLRDPAFTAANPIAGSVMDYNAHNIPLAGETRTELNVTTLGPYDYWAIEYAYRPLDPAREAEELGRIAARSTEPLLAFADDADAGGFGGAVGLDPRDNRFDLGDDPLDWSQRRLALSRELWERVQDRGPRVGDDPLRLRRSVIAGFRQAGRAPEIAAKYVGGMYVERDLPGTGRPTFRPVEPARQRQALQFLTEGLFSVDSFRFQPELLTSLGADFIEWQRTPPLSVPDAVLALQAPALDRLLDAGTARRLLDLPYHLPPPQRAGAISLAELYATLQGAVWAELRSGAEIDPLRRNLQREHLKRLQAMLTRPPANLPSDALSLARMQAGELQAQLQRAVGQGRTRNLSVETRAHLQDSLALLTEALRATMQRSG